MPADEAVSPLRINKTPSTPNSKMNGSAVSRPLSEIGSTERRRNSPSFDQATKKMMFTKEPSPFDSSPFNHSPRLFWKEQTISPKNRFGSENESDQYSPSIVSPKRSSIENLKKASRVKNSSMFAREQKNEYDPTSVKPLERPLAANRPLSVQGQASGFLSSGIGSLRKENEGFKGHRRGESLSKIPTLSPSKASPAKLGTPFSFTSSKDRTDGASPAEGRASPTKSSLVSPGRFTPLGRSYDHDSSMVSEDGDPKLATPRPLRRHAKSVTFDAAPPIINEYEMVTPDPSVVTESREGSYDSEEEFDDSFDQGSMDHDDSFDASLEDTEKTPVVLPEDWRHMSPEAANTSLADTFEDPFDGRERSPMPSAYPNGQTSDVRRGSATSDGESRPLPPLPGMQSKNDRRKRDSSVGLSAAAERASGAHRSLPHPPRPAGVSKADIMNMREASMSLEDRLNLMGMDDDRHSETPTLESPKGKELGVEVKEIEVDDVTETEIDDVKIPHISRESILRRMQSRSFDDYDVSYDAESSPDRSYGDLADLDPDVPIPSREASSNFDDYPHRTAGVAESEADSVIDAYSMGETTEVYDEGDTSVVQECERDSSVIGHEVKDGTQDEDDASQYSPQPSELQQNSQSTVDSSGPPTPKGLEDAGFISNNDTAADYPEFGSFGESELQLDLDPTKPSPGAAPVSKLGAVREFLQRPETPQNQEGEEEEPRTPDSVIRHPVNVEPPTPESVEIPERAATIKAPGAKLKTRPSLTPANAAEMAATRRQVSGEHPPPIPERSPKRQSLCLEIDNIDEENSQVENGEGANKENMMLDIPIGDISADLSFGLDKEFENIIEAQKKGYLMRQNTKIVVASNRQFSDEQPPADVTAAAPKETRSANTSPRKPSADRKPWVKEPWNGKARRRSIRTTSGSRKVAPPSGPAPPLPGQESAVATETIEEQSFEDDIEDGAERGRLFVKVVGVKDLDLPLPKTERSWFQLTLDNGLHCVTTQWLELGHTAPIGQEFELVVLDDLEFQFTLQTKLEPPAAPPVAPVPTTPKAMGHRKTPSAFRNLLSSPKKRKENERKQQEEQERAALKQQQEAQAKRNQQPTAWDLLHNLVGPDGSFARAYVCLKNHEEQAYGRPLNVDIPCFNEWAVDESSSSVKSKRGTVVRRPPYRVGKLQLQLLYVPKPKTAKDEDMPKSMNACIRELKEAEDVQTVSWEGHLSQQGGDCPYWRRRFFRLNGTLLTAYHESTRQPRMTINLVKATKLIDDKSALTQPEKTKSGGRRKSAFADDEEGYMFVEEGFRIRFANGEVIDFYADSAEQKNGWMKVLSETVGKDVVTGRAWAQMVLAKERKEKLRSQLAPQLAQAKALRDANANASHAPPQPSSRETRERERPRSQPEKQQTRTAPNSPQKQMYPPPSPQKQYRAHAAASGAAPPPVEKDDRHRVQSRPRAKTTAGGGRREQVRSMIF